MANSHLEKDILDKVGKYNLSELSIIIEKLPTKSTYIMGDYNINLHDEDKYLHEYDDVIMAAGFTPLISVHTHEQPGCRETCIDNIITNDVEKVVGSGTIKDNLNHHLPIFHKTV